MSDTGRGEAAPEIDRERVARVLAEHLSAPVSEAELAELMERLRQQAAHVALLRRLPLGAEEPAPAPFPEACP